MGEGDGRGMRRMMGSGWWSASDREECRGIRKQEDVEDEDGEEDDREEVDDQPAATPDPGLEGVADPAVPLHADGDGEVDGACQPYLGQR